MFGIGFAEIVLVVVLALLVLGPENLPQLGKALAKVFKEFNKVKREFREALSEAEAEGKDVEQDSSEDAAGEKMANERHEANRGRH